MVQEHDISPYDEVSYGVIPLAYDEKEKLYVFMVQHMLGHWAFPKGHPEQGEDALVTARRELKEETGFEVSRWLPLPPVEESYSFVRDEKTIRKRVVYYYACILQGKELPKSILQRSELKNGAFFLPEELESRATFPEMKRLARTVFHDLTASTLFSKVFSSS